MEKNQEIECHISFTIEKQLKAYTECKDHTDRHEVLWHEWNHNKRWLTQVQQLILPSFPAYSMHDATHSECILHNIEMLLGENNIKNLSATDCFLILHTVYIHDIGMCITHEDKKKILKDSKFYKFLEQLRLNGNTGMSKYAEVLLQECIQVNKNSEKNKYKSILKRKLEVYYAITYLLAEFRRTEHGDVSRKRLIKWIDSPNKLGIGFSTIEIPNRLFYIIANCANTHTKWDFDAVLELHQEDSGFAHDYVHPRFIAILLQLGDALDMDSDRFHPLSKEYLGKLPKISEIHYGKHKAIRRLRITNEKISISADCKNQDELRLVRQECDGIKKILKNVSYYWSVIRPKELNIGLPTFDKTELLLKGNKIPEELVEARFEISQEKAFNLLEGNNIYINENFVFLRELLQNAIDATKIQYFRDCKRQMNRNNNIKDFSNPSDLKKILSPLQYPVEIKFIMAKHKNDKNEKITKYDLKEPHKKLLGYECGVLIKIRDYGTGISEKDINQIAKVGTSYGNRKEEIEKMPKWLKPTGTFGIGLQSAFLSSEVLIAKTFTRKDECYKITFYPRRINTSGYINVMPINNDDNTEPYGTCFEIFIPYTKKRLHDDSPETWDGTDPFEENYDNTKIIRHTRELIKQMIFYLADMIGEPLFPINLWIHDICVADDINQQERFYDDKFKERFRYSRMNVYVNKNKVQDYGVSLNSKVLWSYNLKENNPDIKLSKDKDTYYLDSENARLYVWNHKHSAYACLGIGRILSIRNQLRCDDSFNQTAGVEVFYKGIKVAERCFKRDASLIEYIDLKNKLDSDLLKLNRNGFSEKGYDYLEEVYRDIIITIRKALKYFGKKNIEVDNKKFPYINKLKKRIETLLLLNNEKSLEEFILSTTALIYFAMINERCEWNYKNESEETNDWNNLLKYIIELKTKNLNIINNIWNGSTLFRIPVWILGKRDDTTYEYDVNYELKSVLDIINNENKFAILSIREEKSRFWNEYTIDITSVYKEIKDNINELNNISKSNIENRKKIMDELSKKVESIINYDYDDFKENNNTRKVIFIIKWFLNNAPTMAIFGSTDGNRRLNILDSEICDSVYFDLNMKMLIINRMIETYTRTHISRFSTIVWSGYSCLGLIQNRKSVLSINRGKMLEGYNEMIFPLTGKELKDLIDDKNLNKIKNEIINLYENFVYVILKYTEESDTKEEKGHMTNEKFSKYLRAIQTAKFDEEINNNNKLNFTKDDCKLALSVLEDNQEDNESVSNINKKFYAVSKKINELLSLKDLSKEIQEIYKTLSKNYIKTIQYENIIEYTISHSKRNLIKEQAMSSYNNYINEVISVIFLKNIENIEKNINKEFLNFVKDLK